MPTIVYQGFQSCIEPQMVETTLRLKLSSPNPERDGWNCIQSLTDTTQIPKSSFIYPITKISSYSKLQNISLDLCTENLGCETGTNMIEEADFSRSPTGFNEGENKEREQFRPRRILDTSKRSTQNFPPPLTTMSGSNNTQVRTIRTGGRLVIEAIEAPSSHGCFQAERSNGRLRLSIFKDKENDETNTKYDISENDIEDLQTKEIFVENEEEEIEEQFVNWNMEGSFEKVEVEMGFGKFQRPTRCNERGRNNRGLCNWESFWVATS